MKGRVVSLGIDVSHVDLPIAELSERLINLHLKPQTGADS